MGDEATKAKWDKLQEPFDERLRRVKPNASRAVYVNQSQYIKRLNAIFGPDGWTFNVNETWFLNDNTIAVCLATLTIDGVSKQSYGTNDITTNRNGEIVTDIGDTMKGAQSDALKKAASLFGLGLELWLEPDDKKSPAPDHHSEANEATKGNGNRASAKQIGMIKALASKAGISVDELNKAAQKDEYDSIDFIDKRLASEYIERLQAKVKSDVQEAANE